MMNTRFFSSFAEVEGYLASLGLFRMTPGLDRMRAVLDRLNLTRPPYYVMQVVGTNGKGSTSVMLAALAAAEGLRVGLHTSPHFVSVRERIRVNGEMLPEECWTECAETLMQQGGRDLSYFEFVTALAVLAFDRLQVDAAVMETGLGGAFDATTALDADAVVFTPIALDHRNVLGQSLEEIAADKAQAVRRGRPVITARQRAQALREIERVASERTAHLHVAEPGALPPRYTQEGEPALTGPHQKENASLALAAWKTVRAELGVRQGAHCRQGAGQAPDHISELETRWAGALAGAWLPGRLQRVPAQAAQQGGYAPCTLGWPPMLLDGAHNAHGLAALGQALAKAGTAPLAVVFSCLKDKDVDDIVPHLRALATGRIFVPPVADNPRAMPPEELARLVGLNAEPVASLREALERAAQHMAKRMPEVFGEEESARRNPLLLCGSLYLLGEFYALRPDCLSRR